MDFFAEGVCSGERKDRSTECVHTYVAVAWPVRIRAGVELRGGVARERREEKKGENVLKGYKRAGRDRKLIKCGLLGVYTVRLCHRVLRESCVSYVSSRKLLTDVFTMRDVRCSSPSRGSSSICRLPNDVEMENFTGSFKFLYVIRASHSNDNEILQLTRLINLFTLLVIACNTHVWTRESIYVLWKSYCIFSLTNN